MKSIIFFDIDRTLFDTNSFLDDFHQKLLFKFNIDLKYKEMLTNLYQKSKNDGYFNPQVFLEEISKTFDIDLGKIQKLFWDQKLIDKHLYSDSNLLFDFSKKIQIAIFSKGDEKFQLQKLIKFKALIKKEYIYIFPNKIEKFLEVLKKYSDHKIYLVDDDIKVLQEAKKINSNIFTILIDRDNSKSKNDKIDSQVENLAQILALIHE